MSAKPNCPEQCRDCKWHVKITGLVRGGLHRCRYENIMNGQPCLTVCAETIRKHGGMCLWRDEVCIDD